MIEIVNTHSSEEALKNANKKYNLFPDSKFIRVDLSLSNGDISTIFQEEKRTVFEENINIKECIDKLLKSVKKDKKVRFWTSKSNINHYLMLLFVLELLKDKNLKISIIYIDEVDVYNSNFKNRENCLNLHSLELCLPENIKDYILNAERILAKEEENELLKEWSKLQKKNSPLRIMQRKKCLSVKDDYFDEFILKKLKSRQKIHAPGKFSYSGKPYDGSVSVLYLNMDLIAKYYYKHCLMHTNFFISRIKLLIDNGKIIVVETSKKGFDYFKLKHSNMLN